MKRSSINHSGEPELADRLALSARDRRLESMVLLEMIRRPDATRIGGASRAESDRHDARDVPGADEDSTYARAVSIAGFLCSEYAIEAMDQRVFMTELAVELAQRIAEELAP